MFCTCQCIYSANQIYISKRSLLYVQHCKQGSLLLYLSVATTAGQEQGEESHRLKVEAAANQRLTAASFHRRQESFCLFPWFHISLPPPVQMCTEDIFCEHGEVRLAFRQTGAEVCSPK